MASLWRPRRLPTRLLAGHRGLLRWGGTTPTPWPSSRALSSLAAEAEEEKAPKKVKTVFRSKDRRGEPCEPKWTLPAPVAKRLADKTPRSLPAALDEVLDYATRVRPKKFDECVDIDLKVSTDPRKPLNQVRASIRLPHGSGAKPKRVAAFALSDEAQEAARAAGADLVGGEELIDVVSTGEIQFDVACAHTDALPTLQKRAARVLGPKGLLPSPKNPGTTAETPAQLAVRVHDLKTDAVQALKTEPKFPLIHAKVGRVSFGKQKLLENLREFCLALQAAKPEKAPKGRLIKKATLTTTMGAGIRVDVATLDPGSPRFMREDPNAPNLLQLELDDLASSSAGQPAALAATPWSSSPQSPGPPSGGP